MIAPWPTLRSDPLADYRVFAVRRVVRRSPRTGREHDFFVLDCPDWVNVVAVTPDRQLVCVEQFRHGTETVDLEIPGGVMDAADSSPVETALRELREETGYEGRDARVIGRVRPNPAIMSNTCFTVLVEGCELRHPVAWDHGEDLATRLVPAVQVPALVASGSFPHSLVVAALYAYALDQAGVRPADRAGG